MADSHPTGPNGRAPHVPSRAGGSRKELPESLRPVRGRLKLKGSTKEIYEAPKSRGAVKPDGKAPNPLALGRKKAKPNGEAASKRGAVRKVLPDQVARKPRRSAGDAPGGYVRFRVRVEDGEMSIVDSHHVDGTLVAPESL